MPAVRHDFPTPSFAHVVLFTAAAILLFGCANTPKDTTAADNRRNAAEHFQAGIEVLAWIIDDSQIPTPPAPRKPGGKPGENAPAPAPPPKTLSLAQALAPFSECPVPMSEPARAIWLANGLRVMALPKFQLDELKKSLRIAGPVRRQFFSQTPRWATAFRGPSATATHPIALTLGNASQLAAVDISSGAFRLLMRNWVTPAEGNQPALHLTLVPQHTELRPVAAPTEDRFAEARKMTIIDEGVVFEQMLYEVALNGDEFLLVFPQSPDSSQPAADPPPANRPFGPDIPATPTLGEALLSDALVGGPGTSRVVLVFIPTVPKSFSPLAK